MAFDYSISLNDPSNLGGSDDALLVTDLSAALADWSTHIQGLGVLRVQLNVTGGGFTGELASAGPTGVLAVNGVEEPSSEYELTTGRHEAGTTSDITVNVPMSALGDLYLNPTPFAGGDVPGDEYDAVSVFRHEITHGLGMTGYLDSGDIYTSLAQQKTPFDTLIAFGPGNTAYFTGANAQAVYGGPIPLTTDSATEDYYHFGNQPTDPLADDLMNGLGFMPGRDYYISPIDVAVMQDIGEPTDDGTTVAPYAIVTDTPRETSGGADTTTDYTFTVTRHGDLTDALTLSYGVEGVAGGTGVVAATPDEFAGGAFPTGNVSFGAGSNTTTITVAVAGSAVLRPTTGFGVVLNDPSGNPYAAAGATIGNDQPSSGPRGVTRDVNGTAEVYLQGTHTQYLITTPGNDEVTVGDSVAGRDGAQTVQDAANLVFSDGVGVVDATGNAEDVAHLYQAAFDRAPDLTGLDYWTNMLNDGSVSLGNVAAAFLTSSEFAGPTNGAGLIDTLYQNVLHRAPDQAGLEYWTSLLSGGTTNASALIGFATSPENLANTIATTGDVDSAQTTRLYQAAFDRAPDTDSLAFWSSALRSGATPQMVADGFAATSEFNSDYADLSNAEYVGTLYQNVLGRAGDAVGESYWDSQLAAGVSRSTVLLGFANSPENLATTASATHAGWVYVPNANVA